MLTSTFHDLRYASRVLLKHRNFTAAALLTLALGIGINTSIFTLAAIGTAIGLAVAIVLMKIMSTMLFGIAPAFSSAAIAFAAVSIGALAVALLACYIPARRATKVNPLIALRNE